MIGESGEFYFGDSGEISGGVDTEQERARAELGEEYDRLEAAHAETDELPEDVDARLAEIEAALHGYDERPAAFEPDEIARAGAFVSIDGEGRLRVERGYARPEDELPVAPEPDVDDDGEMGSNLDGEPSITAQPFRTGETAVHEAAPADADAEDGLKPLPDRLLTELTAHRTLALTAPIPDALPLQRPLADGLLSVVARGEKWDPPVSAAKRQSALLL